MLKYVSYLSPFTATNPRVIEQCAFIKGLINGSNTYGKIPNTGTSIGVFPLYTFYIYPTSLFFLATWEKQFRYCNEALLLQF